MKNTRIKQRKVWGAVILFLVGSLFAFKLELAMFNAWTFFALGLYVSFVGSNHIDKRQHLKHNSPSKTDQS